MNLKTTLCAVLLAGFATAASAAVTAGLDAGYLVDNKDAYWSGRVGWEFSSGGSLSHQLALEVGTTKHTESITAGPFKTVSKLTPITINYRAETTAANKLGFYFGAGAGQSRVKFEAPGSGVPVVNASDDSLVIQGFAGVSYKATPSATLHVGAKYIWIDEVKLLGFSKLEVGDDLALTAGVSVRF